MKQSELETVLSELTAERLALLQRHEAAARVISDYDFNNTYQYVINREETHVAWLQSALAELGESLPPAAGGVPQPPEPKNTRAAASKSLGGIAAEDARLLASFVERWRDRVDGVTHARHRTMLNVILGESREHQRFFEQAAAGMEDLLGRRTTVGARLGAVLPTRWKE